MTVVKIKIFLIIGPMVIWLLIFNWNLDYHHMMLAQSTLSKPDVGNKNLKTYTNNQYNFVISYPANWEKIEFAQGITESGRQILATFLSPLESPSDSFREYLTIEVANFSPGTAVDNAKLIKYADSQVDGYMKSLHGFHLLAKSEEFNNINELPIGNPSCYEVIYSHVDATAGKINVLDTYCARNSKIYLLSFQSDSVKYSSYLPLVKEIVNSFKLV